MNRQEVFNKVYRHLILQGERSENNLDECVYRGMDDEGDYSGLSCAIGCLIDDEHYNEMMEGLTPKDPMIVEALRKSGVDVKTPVLGHYDLGTNRHGNKFCYHNRNNPDVKFLMNLQGIHDDVRPDMWEEELGNFATQEGLTVPQQLVE